MANTYVIPGVITTNNKELARINNLNGLIPNSLIDFVSPAKNTAVSILYGIGVNRAIIDLSVQGDMKDVYPTGNYPVSIDDMQNAYSPDAIPDGNGGFTKTAQWDGMMSSSLIGMPVMCSLEFTGGSYYNLKGEIIDVPTIIFETVLITVTQNRNIESTDIAGRDGGSVKEFIGLGDWDIDIRAIITASAPVNTNVAKRNQDGVYPRANMEQIWKLLKAPLAIPVKCWFLNQFEIDHIVIMSGCTMEQVEGEYEMQRLVMPCKSDNPLIITIRQ